MTSILRDNEYQRKDRHQYFIDLTYLIATRSHDAQTQHGAIFIKDDRIIATGFNGFPPGAPDDELPNLRPNKYPYVNHAEENGIYSAAKLGIPLEGSTLYVTGKPCCHCTRKLVTLGIFEWHIGDRSHQFTEEEKALSEFWINHYNVRIYDGYKCSYQL